MTRNNMWMKQTGRIGQWEDELIYRRTGITQCISLLGCTLQAGSVWQALWQKQSLRWDEIQTK